MRHVIRTDEDGCRHRAVRAKGPVVGQQVSTGRHRQYVASPVRHGEGGHKGSLVIDPHMSGRREEGHRAAGPCGSGDSGGFGVVRPRARDEQCDQENPRADRACTNRPDTVSRRLADGSESGARSSRPTSSGERGAGASESLRACLRGPRDLGHPSWNPPPSPSHLATIGDATLMIPAGHVAMVMVAVGARRRVPRDLAWSESEPVPRRRRRGCPRRRTDGRRRQDSGNCDQQDVSRTVTIAAVTTSRLSCRIEADRPSGTSVCHRSLRQGLHAELRCAERMQAKPGRGGARTGRDRRPPPGIRVPPGPRNPIDHHPRTRVRH